MKHSIQAPPSAKPTVWRRIFPHDAGDEIERERADRPDDPTEPEEWDPDETPPMPMPAVRIWDRSGERNG